MIHDKIQRQIRLHWGEAIAIAAVVTLIYHLITT